VLSPGGASAATPSARVASILAATRAQHSVHYVSIQEAGTTSVSIVADAGKSSGIQRITYRKAGKSGHVTVIVVARTAYVRGDAFTLRQFMGFTAADATKYADRWMLVRHTHPGYDVVAEDVTFASAVSGLTPEGQLENVSGTKIGGRPVIGVRGTTTSRGQKVVTTLLVAADGRPLPVREVSTGLGGTVQLTFSSWNEAVHVRAPRGAVEPGAPPKGTIA
jgi:hypothetical protein